MAVASRHQADLIGDTRRVNTGSHATGPTVRTSPANLKLAVANWNQLSPLLFEK